MSIRWTIPAVATLFAAAALAADPSGQTAPGAEQQTGSYPSTFEELDSDGDGYVSQEEAAENPHLVENWMALDRDESGRLDRSEFAAFEEVYREGDEGPRSEGAVTPMPLK